MYAWTRVRIVAKQWAKLYRGATLREPLVELAQRNKLAFGLYFVLCAEADDFGRFTALEE